MRYCRFIDDPSQIAELEGQRFVVLRPVAEVAAAYREVRQRVGMALHGRPAPCPAEPHVTLAAVGQRAPVARVREIVTDWAQETPALRLEIERVSVFPAPFQIVIVQIRRTPELFEALTSIRRRIGEAGLQDLAAVSPAQWVFHMSVAYCSSLPAEDWAEVVDAVQSIQAAPAIEVVQAVEVVAFDNHEESSGGVVVLPASTGAPGGPTEPPVPVPRT